MSFRVPDWASTPEEPAVLKVYSGERLVEELDVSRKPFYLFGAPGCDIVLGPASAGQHAALVHREGGKTYLIDLGLPEGTLWNGKSKLAPNRPTKLTEGTVLQFGSAPQKYVFHSSAPAGAKRKAASMGPDAVRASHLLVKHRQSRRPSSWKEPTVTRSPEEALAMIKGFREDITSGRAEFGELARRESHCSSAKAGGDLGTFKRGAMQPAFEQAAFGLQVGELSMPVHSDSGVHLILRTA